MLADRVRNDAFRAALSRLIQADRTTVADIGAGTGILAFLARELGAREVWLYDSGPVLGLAEAIAARNGIDKLNFVPERSLDVAIRRRWTSSLPKCSATSRTRRVCSKRCATRGGFSHSAAR